MYEGVFKQNSGIMDKLAMNRQLAASSVAEGVNSSINGAYQSAESFWNEDGTGYQRAGSVISSLGAMGMGVGVATAFGFAVHGGALFSPNSYRRAFSKVTDKAMGLIGRGGKYTEVEARSLGGKIFGENAVDFRTLSGNKVTKIAGGEMITYDSVMSKGAMNAAKSKAGVWRFATEAGERSGYFVKNSRLMSGLGGGLMIVGTVLASMALEAGTSLAGRLMDEAQTAYTQSKFHTYDLRDFNNRSMQQWGFNKQNQAATNLMPYEQNNLSLARLYYSR